jgi:hypothetical protein
MEGKRSRSHDLKGGEIRPRESMAVEARTKETRGDPIPAPTHLRKTSIKRYLQNSIPLPHSRYLIVLVEIGSSRQIPFQE